MKFTVNLRDKKLKTVFKVAGDYIDAVVDRRLLVLFTGLSDMFVMATIMVNTMDDFLPTSFRIPKAGFFSMMEEGVVSFMCGEDRVYVSFEGNDISRTMSFARQACSDTGLGDKLKIVTDAPKYPVFPMHDLIVPAKLLRSSRESLAVSDGIAFANLSGLQLYAHTKCPDCALFPWSLSHLSTVCDGGFDNVHAVRDYVVYTDGLYHVLLNKVNARVGNDVRFVMRQPATYSVTVDFSKAITLLTRVRDFEEADLNLRREELVLRAKGCEYSARIMLTYPRKESAAIESVDDLLNATEPEIPRVRFPAEVFRSISDVTKSKTLDIVCTKTLVRVSLAKGLMLVCRKELADE